MCKSGLGYVLIAFVILFSASCANYKNIPYFKDISDSGAIYSQAVKIDASSYPELKIQPDDILEVNIYTKDGQPSTAAASLASSGAALSTQAGSMANAAAGASGTVGSGYLVDKEGLIEVPTVGKVHVAGLTTSEAKEIIRKAANATYRDPVVNVRISNFKVTVLGEVNRPGNYLVDGEEVSVLDALGMAGDMTIFGKRENVLLIRKNGDKKEMVRFDLNSAKTVHSPYFYLRQGDVVYVEPGKGKAANTDAAQTRVYALVGSGLSVLIALIALLRR